MIKTFLIITLMVAALNSATITYEMTTAQINRLIDATIYFDPVPKINIGTIEEPVMVDSCSAAAWTKWHYENIMRKTYRRYYQRIRTDTITIPDM